MNNLVMYSKTNATWSKHIAAWNLLKEFRGNMFETNWIMNVEQAREFVIWALHVKKLKHSTVKSYLYSIKLAHTLNNQNCPNYNGDEIIKMMFKGADNISLIENPGVRDRYTMTMNTLLILGHRIASSDWRIHSKQVVWTVFLTSFFSSCRMGELVAPTEKTFDPSTTLLWKHVVITDSYVNIFIPFTKTKGLKGHLIEIFPFEMKNCCPYTALKGWETYAKKTGFYEKNLPVFTFESGKFLTTNKLNDILKSLLSDLGGKGKASFTCHSFRAAIPTLIALHPDKSYVADIKEWGEWDSPAYTRYLKLEHDRKKYLFSKIAVLLCKSV